MAPAIPFAPPTISQTTSSLAPTGIALDHLPILLSQRDNANSQPTPYVVTLSITRAYTTYTTTLVLGGTQTSQPTADPVTPATVQSPAPEQNAAPSNQATIIGATVGSICGVILLAGIIYVCYVMSRRQGGGYWRRSRHSSSSGSRRSGGSSGSSSAGKTKRVRVEKVRTERVRVVPGPVPPPPPPMAQGGGFFGGGRGRGRGRGRNFLDDD